MPFVENLQRKIARIQQKPPEVKRRYQLVIVVGIFLVIFGLWVFFLKLEAWYDRFRDKKVEPGLEETLGQASEKAAEVKNEIRQQLGI